MADLSDSITKQGYEQNSVHGLKEPELDEEELERETDSYILATPTSTHKSKPAASSTQTPTKVKRESQLQTPPSSGNSDRKREDVKAGADDGTTSGSRGIHQEEGQAGNGAREGGMRSEEPATPTRRRMSVFGYDARRVSRWSGVHPRRVDEE